jgi:hypothetical protein
MTYILDLVRSSSAIDIESLTVLKNTSNNDAVTTSMVIPLDGSIQLYNSDSYTVSNGVITLPSGYYYLIKFVLSAYTFNISTSTVSYQLYDTNSSSYIGRRGWLAWQEYPQLNGGDEYAIALVDASSSSKQISAKITSVTGSGIYMDSTESQAYLAGYTRCEIYKWS